MNNSIIINGPQIFCVYMNSYYASYKCTSVYSIRDFLRQNYSIILIIILSLSKDILYKYTLC